MESTPRPKNGALEFHTEEISIPLASSDGFINEENNIEILRKHINSISSRTKSLKTNSRAPAKRKTGNTSLEDEQQQQMPGLNIILKELKEIKCSIASLAKGMENIKCQQEKLANETKIAATFVKRREVAEYQRLFPIQDIAEMEKLETGPHEVIDIAAAVREIIADKTLSKKIFSIFGSKVIMDFNFEGTSGKKCLKKYIKINNSIFTALTKQGYTRDDYAQEMKAALKRAKNCLHKKESLLRTQIRNKTEETVFVAC